MRQLVGFRQKLWLEKSTFYTPFAEVVYSLQLYRTDNSVALELLPLFQNNERNVEELVFLWNHEWDIFGRLIQMVTFGIISPSECFLEHANKCDANALSCIGFSRLVMAESPCPDTTRLATKTSAS